LAGVSFDDGSGSLAAICAVDPKQSTSEMGPGLCNAVDRAAPPQMIDEFERQM
jgi:hypothetical protein